MSEDEEVGVVAKPERLVEAACPMVDRVDGKRDLESHGRACLHGVAQQCRAYALAPEVTAHGKRVELVFAWQGLVLHAGELDAKVLPDEGHGGKAHLTVAAAVVGRNHAGSTTVRLGYDGIPPGVENVGARADVAGKE